MPKLVLCPSGMPSKKYPYFSKRKPRKMAKEKTHSYLIHRQKSGQFLPNPPKSRALGEVPQIKIFYEI